MGTYEPDDPSIHTIQTHFAAIPMFHIGFHAFYAMAGYGLNYSYHRTEMINDQGVYETISDETNSGELRINAGIKQDILPQIALFAEGGYAWVSEENQSFSAGGGIAFSLSPKTYQNKLQKSPTIKTPELPRYKSISLVGYKDPILRELNVTIESALLNAETQVMSWEKVSTELLKQRKNISQNMDEDLYRNLDPVQTAIEGAKILNIDAVIDVYIRYTYKSYGGKIIVNSASIRIIDPKTGNINYAVEPDVEGMDYFKCKQEITRQILKMFQ